MMRSGAEAEDAELMATWIQQSLVDTDGTPVPLADAAAGAGYLDAMLQASLLLRGPGFWMLVAERLISAGVLDPRRHGRYV